MRIILNLVVLLILVFCNIGKAKSNFIKNSIDSIIVKSDCEFNFERDLKKGKPKLLLVGSVAPVYVQGQEKHEKKFGFEYYDFGCQPDSEDCMKVYNFQTFEYLDKKFGKAWRKEVRPDVLHLTQK